MMIIDEQTINSKWRYLQAKLSTQFGADIDTVNTLYLIGIQESGAGFDKYSKDEKTSLITIGNNKVMSYFGYYRQAGTEENGWPAYKQIESTENLSQEKKDVLIMEGIIRYFIEIEYI
jgi:hypothetical protein